MKAAVLEATRTLVCKEVETPQLAAGEVLVRVAYCGVCGSDVPRYLDGAVHGFPLILGHEFSGEVVAVGSEVSDSLIGTRVAGIPLVPCMECPDCEAGNYSLCKQYGFVGSRRNGAYAEYVAVPRQNVYPVSDDVPLLQAAFFEPASVAQHAIDLVAPKAGATAAVVGCGTIGIFVAQILQAMGLEVVGLARREVRLAAARSAGVMHLCDTSQEGWEISLVKDLPGGGFDYLFDTSGNGSLMVKTFGLAANKATICMVGTPKRSMEFSVAEWENINRKELTIMGTWMSYSAPFPGREWTEIDGCFASGVLRVTDEMIDGVYPLEEIAEAMERFATPGAIAGKLVVKCQ